MTVSVWTFNDKKRELFSMQQMKPVVHRSSLNICCTGSSFSSMVHRRGVSNYHNISIYVNIKCLYAIPPTPNGFLVSVQGNNILSLSCFSNFNVVRPPHCFIDWAPRVEILLKYRRTRWLIMATVILRVSLVIIF